jgi:hypothetical protein
MQKQIGVNIFRYEKPKSGIQNHFISPVDVWSKIGRRDELTLLPRLPNIRAANKSRLVPQAPTGRDETSGAQFVLARAGRRQP